MGALRIMVADDHEVVRRGLRALLETRPGWQVCAEAADGRDVLKKDIRIEARCNRARHRDAEPKRTRSHAPTPENRS